MAASHNFIEGIDWDTDPTGNTPLAARIFVAHGGDDATLDGSDPSTPYKTISAAQSNGSSKTYVIGTGTYTPFNLISTTTFICDGVVIFEDNGTNRLFSSNTSEVRGAIIYGYLNVMPSSGTSRGNLLTNCVVINTSITTALFGASSPNNMTGCKFINTTISHVDSRNSTYDKCFFKNSSLEFTGTSAFTVKNSHIESDSTIDLQTTGTKTFSYNNNNGTFLGTPNVSVGNINLDPLFTGTVSKLEFTVAGNSPLLGSGENGSIIGNVKTGSIQNVSSAEWGVSPEVVGDTEFDLNDALVLTLGTSSTRESTSINLGQPRTSPTVKLNGLTDYLANVPDFDNSLFKHNALTFEAQYAGADGIFNGVWKVFRYNLPMNVDDNGRTSGELLYRYGSTTDLTIKFIKVRATIRDDYTQS